MSGEQQDKQRAIEPLKPELVGACMFLVHDHMGNCHERFDTLPKAVDHAETLVEEYSENAADGWSGDGDIEVLQVIKRWSLLPIPTPEGEDPASEWADLLEAELPALLKPITEGTVEAAFREWAALANRGLARSGSSIRIDDAWENIKARIALHATPTDANPG